MLIPLGFLGTGAKYDFELISTQVLSSTQNVTFSSIPQGYKHLQLRVVARDATNAAGNTSGFMRFNGVTTSSYTQHGLNSGGSTPSSFGSSSAQTAMYAGLIPSNSGGTSQFAGLIIDILDYTSTSKNKTMRSFSGISGASTDVGLYSGAYLSTSALSQIDFYTTNGFVSGSRFSLYGVRG